MTDHSELRRLAKAATPGPWRVQTGCSWRRIGTDHGDGDVLRPCTHPHDGWPDIAAPVENLEYIAAANPKAILALLDEIDRLKAENEVLRGALQAVVDDPTWRSNDNSLWPKIIKAMNPQGATSSP
ncbi:ead/Ea22-like family protein [Pseudomonas aeruginosa]|nr:ead/Ea22-like family protein [Pseudomonas aeruginosa]MBX5792033.1 ead/Ea22-like family protein [Pseudomonas aeruginosa]